MPYDPVELKEKSKELKPGEDPTLTVGDKTGGGVDEDNQNPQYHPVIDKNEKILLRDDGSTLDWKNYRFEAQFEDGTRQEFVFTAKNDGDAQAKVQDRIGPVTKQKGTYKLSLVEAPKEVFAGEFGKNEKVLKTNEKDAEKKSEKPKATEAKKTEEKK